MGEENGKEVRILYTNFKYFLSISIGKNTVVIVIICVINY